MKYRYIIMMLIGLSAVSLNTHTAYGQSLDSYTTLDEIDLKKNVIIFATRFDKRQEFNKEVTNKKYVL